MKPRDNQRSKVYQAENEVRHLSKPLATFQETCAYARKVCNSAWLRKNYAESRLVRDNKGISVGDGRGRRIACGCYYSCEIRLPKWARTEIVALHEIAHVLVSHNKVAGHGPEFALCFLKLVKHFMGRETYEALKAAYKRNRVRTKAKAKRILTDEQKEILRERVAKARAARFAVKEMSCDRPAIPSPQDSITASI